MNTQTQSLQPGNFIGDLQVSAILGENRRDVSYLVTDPAIGTRFVLREYLPTDLVNRDEQDRLVPVDGPSGQLFLNGLEGFLNEARIAAALDHPNVARILRYFEANGTAYFLMPYYQGHTLRKDLDSGKRFNREEARALLLPLMEALEYIHAEGVIHQNIQPSNIFLATNNQPVLLDFRLAAGGLGDTSLTREMEQSAYAAPEQFLPREAIGPWIDIYALAACMYQCVTGKLPVPGAERLEKISKGEPDPLTPFSELAPAALYGGLCDAVELGLKTDVQQRPGDVAHWKKSFKSLDWHRSVVVSGDTGSHEAEKKERLPLILLGVFVTIMIALGIVLLSDWSPDKYPVTFNETQGESNPSEEPVGKPKEPDSVELKRWQAALEADTIDGYRRFIEDFPNSIYLNQAGIQLNILDERNWTELSSENSIPAYQRYLELFPAGIHQAAALQRIEGIQQAESLKERQRIEREKQERLAWEAASSTRSIKAMDQYINDWPAGLHIEEARRIRRLLQDQSNDDKAFQTALKLNNIEAFQTYIDAFPTGANVTAALQHIDDLTLRPGKSFKDCQNCPEMTVVPTAAFWQGSADHSELALDMEKPRRLVTINEPFAVSTHEITMAEWDHCYEDGGCKSQPADNGWGRETRPVIMVSWNDVQEYVHWMSEKTGEAYRLPSESEWEYFARAGEESDWPGGSPEAICQYGNIAGAETGFRWQHANCSDQLALGTTPVGSFKANAFGLFDTTGNVSEWTADCMNLSYLDAPVDGSSWGRGICSSHMTRGGSWITGTREIRLPARFNLKNGDRNDFTGFRVVRDIEE